MLRPWSASFKPKKKKKNVRCRRPYHYDYVYQLNGHTHSERGQCRSLTETQSQTESDSRSVSESETVSVTVCHTKANINQAESLGTLPMLIGWNGLLLVDPSATDRPVAKHPFSYLNTCNFANLCHFFTIAIKARKKIVVAPNCSQCALSRLKM